MHNIEAEADAFGPELVLTDGTTAHVPDRIEDRSLLHATPLVNNSRYQEAHGFVAALADVKRLGVVHLGVLNFEVANVDHDKPVGAAVVLHRVLYELIEDLLVDPQVDAYGWRYFVKLPDNNFDFLV